MTCEKFVLLKRYGKNRRISPNISTTTETIFSNVSAMAEACMQIIQEAPLWYRDRATLLSVEILQLQNIPFEN